MSWIDRLKNGVSPAGLSRDLDREIAFHLAEKTDELVSAGTLAAEAHDEARRRFGNATLVKERARDVNILPWLESIARDFSYALRMLGKDRGFTAVAVLSLGLGVGATTTVFSLADALLLRPLPVPRADKLLTVGSTSPDTRFGNWSYREYLDFKAQETTFERLTAYTITPLAINTRRGDLPIVKTAAVVSGDFFQVLDVPVAQGRSFLPDEDRVPGRDAVAVISHALWLSEFNSSAAALGSIVKLNGVEFTIVGIAPPNFTGPDGSIGVAVYLPLMMWPRVSGRTVGELLERRGNRSLVVKGRLKSGISLAQANAQFSRLAKSAGREHPETNRAIGAIVRTEIAARVLQNEVLGILVTLFSVLAFAVLVVSCANVAGLLLSRGRARAREIALRLALGCARLRLIRQLLIESLVIAALGAMAGIFIAYGGTTFLKRIDLPMADGAPLNQIQLDGRVLLFTLAVALLSAFAFGLAPAITSTRTDLAGTMKDPEALASLRERLLGRSALVTGQVSCSLVLLTIASVVYAGFKGPLTASPGFRTSHVLMLNFDPALLQYSTSDTQRFYKKLAAEVAATPGVISAGLTNVVPLDFEQDSASIVPEGFDLPKDRDGGFTVLAASVDPGFFRALGIPVITGRGFQVTDDEASPRVALINEAAAQRFWPKGNAIGKRFRIDGRTGQLVEIVGIVKTTKYTWIAEDPAEYIYFPLPQRPRTRLTLMAFVQGDPLNLVAPMRDVVRKVDPNQPIFRVRTIEDFYRKQAVGVPDTLVQTILALGATGLALALVGLYGLVAYSVSQRTREIGIRLALGAERSEVLMMILRRALRIGLVGLIVGLGASFTAEKLLIAAFSRVSSDLLIYAGLPPVILALIVLASWGPAQRASRVDPMVALRYD